MKTKTTGSRVFGSIIIVVTAATSIATVEGGTGASAYYADANCTSSPLIINMAGDCSGDAFACPVYDTPGTSEFCIPDRTKFFTTGLGEARYILAEYYNDATCTSLSSAGAYLADGSCHEYTQFDASIQSVITVVDSDGAVSVEGNSGDCYSTSETYYHLQAVPAANITGECLAVDLPPRGDAEMTHGVKYYFVPSTSSATAAGSSSATESPTPTTAPNTITETPTSSGALVGSESTLFCAVTMAAITLF